ncbi:carbonic anhydrase [Georgenia sp. TF02-10]|nr:carbonic anhydrase [Georgenia sp. TF02-10]UNX55633.1 carbonic anhydrase [Georgenia sp. TF02-10]
MTDATDTTALSPAQAWERLRAGNARFAAGEMVHPGQGADRRAELAHGQHPGAVLLGCSDSRVAAEVLFDQGLGDLFVVRTAGHVLDPAVLGSVEYGVEVLGTPLVVVLGHDRCGALAAATEALVSGTMPGGFVRSVVERVLPSLLAGPGGRPAREPGRRGFDLPDDDELRRMHVRATVEALVDRSSALAAAVAEGRCAVVGLEYALAEGTVAVVHHLGPLPV